MNYKFSDEAIERVAKKQYDLNCEAQSMTTENDSTVFHIDDKASRLQAVEWLIRRKLKHYPQDTIEEAVNYGIYCLKQGHTVYRSIHRSITLTRRLADLPGPTAA